MLKGHTENKKAGINRVNPVIQLVGLLLCLRKYHDHSQLAATKSMMLKLFFWQVGLFEGASSFGSQHKIVSKELH